MTKAKKASKEKTTDKLFKEGGKPGPGRGHKVDKPEIQAKPLTMNDIESALQQDLQSKDPKVRHPATRLLLALKKQVGQQDADSTVMDRWVQELILFLGQMQANIHEGTGETITGMGVIQKMSKVCLTCSKLGAVDSTYQEVGDYDYM